MKPVNVEFREQMFVLLSSTMAAAFALWLLSLASGCVYAPRAHIVAGQVHYQSATNIFITQTIPLEPRIANEITGAAGIKGDVGRFP